MKPKQRRWTCPSCGAGKLAPQRPRMDDTRRYCLPCSESTGRLVQRVSASAARARDTATERRKARDESRRASAARAREKRAEAKRARRLVGALDIPTEFRRLANLQQAKSRLRGVRLNLKRTERGSRGRATGHSVVIYADHTATEHEVKELLAHEITHHIVWGEEERDGGSRSRSRWHGVVFKRALIALVKSAYRIGPEFDEIKAEGYVHSRDAYSLDEYLTDCIRRADERRAAEGAA